MKPERRQAALDRLEWRIGLQTWEVHRPRWLPEFDAPVTITLTSLGVALVGAFALLAAPLFGPIACAISAALLLTAAAALLVSQWPRYGRISGPLLVLGLGPTHLEVSADWPNMPADRLTAVLAGMGWAEAGGRRIPWAEMLGVRLSKNKTHIEFMLRSGEHLRLPVAGSRRWDRTLAKIVEELDEHRRHHAGGTVPKELRDLQRRI